ncbi:flippase [Psychroflexus salis]|uniref:Polysaccharide biosynthesis related protein n=1 Tax=Psychroflexus salis TaxID=1526574 RepID=A0A917E4C0_9FLAO|nr:flippase [Psychroflexus salis]GGE02422.1 polysaccharide biosynthesis related protein [Psychroflexus salis]
MITKFKKAFQDADFKEILTKGFSFLLLKVGGTIVGYLFTLFITLKFGANIYGVVAFSFSIFMIVSVVGKLGLDTNILKFFSDNENDKDSGLFYKSVLKSFVFSSVLSLLIFSFRYELVFQIFEVPKPQLLPYLPWVLAAIPLWSVNHISAGYLRAKKHTKSFAFFYNPARFLFSLLILSILYLITQDPIITVQAHFFAVLLSAICSFLLVSSQIKKKQKRSKVNSWSFMFSGIPMMFSSSILILLGWMDTFVMGIYEDDSEIGIYNVSLKVATLASFSLEAINAILAPKIAKDYLTNNSKNYKRLISFSTKLNFLISSFVIIAIILLKDILLGMFGIEFLAGATILIVFCFGQLINSFSGSVGVILQMTGKQKIYQNIVLVALVINLMLTFALTPIYGGVGAAIATVISMAFWNLGGAIYLKLYLNITSYFNPFKRDTK